ncbi:hypothetical protein N7335_02115 [Stutzerimonas stutzeri]|uniref:Uncharacterized protein n=1 Tax=Stutzerimonas stutzeri TaxID=316 RepID=A0AA42KQ58_STUST|nr:hypothetical protein [Stutzerimonas stutzeri]MDH0145182.1 hypothetical protein [Stutzerimonas stutzeri]MDH0149563.1 hypothetical protein [Stutzerimonas stutzeri]
MNTTILSTLDSAKTLVKSMRRQTLVLDGEEQEFADQCVEAAFDMCSENQLEMTTKEVEYFETEIRSYVAELLK